MITRDLLQSCPTLRDQAAKAQIAYGVNVEHFWETSGKAKTLDLAIGIPKEKPLITSDIGRIAGNRRKSGEVPSVATNVFSRILITCEAKAVMTEHLKSQPRIFDELSSSHEIVHNGDLEAIATGIVMVNVATTFASPLRQTDPTQVYFSRHKQPSVTQRMITHLRGLRIRDKLNDVGFDAFCTFLVDCDNQNQCLLHTGYPAPQPGDKDHYDTFIKRIGHYYAERFSTLL